MMQVNNGGGRPLPPDSIEYALVSHELTLKLIDSWMQHLRKISSSKHTFCEKYVSCSRRFLLPLMNTN